MGSSGGRVGRRRRTVAPFPIQTESANEEPDSSRGDSICQKCGSGDDASELLLCDKCDGGCHLFCLKPILVSVPKGPWFCPTCSAREAPKRFPLIQTKIIDFFRIQRSFGHSVVHSEKGNGRKRKRSGLVLSKKKRRLLPYIPTEDISRRFEQMASLAMALTSTCTEFSDDLTYMPGMASRSDNCAAHERGGMQVLGKEDADALRQCKSMLGGGEWPPLMVVFDPLEGFTVEADEAIKDLTIITEYAGDVDYLKNRADDDGDSMMTLVSPADSGETLVICPEKRGNIARFINGVNNHTREGMKKRNLKCVRYGVDGECRVLLVAIRDISKGERLYYDYNGYENEYPTRHFL